MKTKNEQIKDLHIRFLSDRRIKTLQNEIAAIYNVAIPKGILKTDGSFKLVYDEKIEYEVNRIKMIIKDIVKEDYSGLIEPGEPDHDGSIRKQLMGFTEWLLLRKKIWIINRHIDEFLNDNQASEWDRPEFN